jgi:pheromone shutdown protein TraB
VARHLIYVPVVHSEADMGSMASAVTRSLRLRPDQHRTRQEKIARFWEKVRASLLAALDERLGGAGSLARVRIYQDGLPTSGELARRIARESAAKGSHNYSLVLELLDRGAALEQTESPDLLREEYSMLRRKSRNARRASELLELRDRFMADRINATLQEGETGVLFIGALHKVGERLASDIEVSMLVV